MSTNWYVSIDTGMSAKISRLSIQMSTEMPIKCWLRIDQDVIWVQTKLLIECLSRLSIDTWPLMPLLHMTKVINNIKLVQFRYFYTGLLDLITKSATSHYDSCEWNCEVVAFDFSLVIISHFLPFQLHIPLHQKEPKLSSSPQVPWQRCTAAPPPKSVSSSKQRQGRLFHSYQQLPTTT